jgi:hypothetical protein
MTIRATAEKPQKMTPPTLKNKYFKEATQQHKVNNSKRSASGHERGIGSCFAQTLPETFKNNVTNTTGH